MNTPADIEQTLGLHRPPPVYKKPRFWLLLTLLAAVAAGAAVQLRNPNGAPLRFKTAEVERGKLIVGVTATGTLEPLNQVQVGTEVSGTVSGVAVDYNDRVEVGQVLATLDTAKLEAQAAQSQAEVALAQAKLSEAEAGVAESRNNLARLAQVRKLSGGKLPSQQELETAEAALKRARAGEATARAQIAQAEAKHRMDATNLSKTVIRAPIAGIVLSRLVEPGQTVAASLQSPVLFTLAEDLRQMELQVDVDEADVGQVRTGQRASFTVAAYPERKFEAQITQVRYAPQTLNNVVTYKTLLTVDNAELLLRPGMTATADIVVEQIDDALLIPNTALRFSPPTAQEKAANRGFVASLLRGPPPPRKPAAPSGKDNQRVWVVDGAGQPRAVTIKLGATDGRRTQVVEGDLATGALVALEVLKAQP